ncbi:MAG: ATP synthase F1 subunit delta [Paramuribaculum sp.]|nr:ATP synthase F1 subunit delta [Paramuribaculum sp.]
MNDGLIPRRYAKALLEFAKPEGADARVYGLMLQLNASFEAEPALQQAVANPFVSAADKTALLTVAAGLDNGKSDPVFADFLKLLVERGRIDMIRSMALAYIDLYRRANNIFSVTVTSASPLNPYDLDRLKALVARHLGSGATLEFTDVVDPSLIGGFAISVGNERLDASIANELNQLRRQILSNS